jgi:hypothetical protein
MTVSYVIKDIGQTGEAFHWRCLQPCDGPKGDTTCLRPHRRYQHDDHAAFQQPRSGPPLRDCLLTPQIMSC